MPTLPRRRRLTLRSRVLLIVMVLLTAVSGVVGTVTVLVLHDFLMSRLDTQLTAAGGRSLASGHGNGRPATPPSGADRDLAGGASFLLAPGQAAGTLGARIKGGRVVAAAVLRNDGTLTTLTAASVPELAGVPTGHPATVRLGALGSYRVLGERTDEGDVLITGLPLAEVDNTVRRLVLIEVVVAGTGVVLAGAVGVLSMTRSLRPLRRVAATASRVSALPLARGEVELTERLDARDVDDHTEVGQVAGAVNRLLDHVSSALTARHESENNVRRFVADASHELRTPLTAIRGYAELTRRHRDAAPPQLAFAMERVESEARRMTVMVEDLLLLARLDAGRPLSREPVDLTQLLVNAVADANASSTDHGWRLSVPDEPVVVTGDRSALHQVAANLLANARVHTPAGTTVTTSLAGAVRDGVTITVLDDGPGIPAEVLATVFERFARGEQARSHAVGSTGLGLAIVQAIVTAHGGSVEVESRPGRTAFRVRLPVD